MFRKKYINAIHNIGSKDNEDNHNVSETTFIDDKWATQYCDTFVYNLKVDRFKKLPNQGDKTWSGLATQV